MIKLKIFNSLSESEFNEWSAANNIQHAQLTIVPPFNTIAIVYECPEEEHNPNKIALVPDLEI